MIEVEEWTFEGSEGPIAARSWHDSESEPRFIALLVHGYGEHIGRYEHVASALIANGAVVYGLDHLGHGESGGERVLVTDVDHVIEDVHAVATTARAAWPDVPVILIGHSMGGLIGARYAQVHGDELRAVVLSGPAIGQLDILGQLLAMDEIPDVPIDPAVLSRDLSVGEAYAADPLVWHGPFKRPTVAAMAKTMREINEAGSLGRLPLLWVHGSDDQLVPIDGTRVGIERLRGDIYQERVYAGARHEVFNETNSDEVLADVNFFIDQVLA
jgi:alpha-beta hydrolase superfamily lysophospholipase